MRRHIPVETLLADHSAGPVIASRTDTAREIADELEAKARDARDLARQLADRRDLVERVTEVYEGVPLRVAGARDVAYAGIDEDKRTEVYVNGADTSYEFPSQYTQGRCAYIYQPALYTNRRCVFVRVHERWPAERLADGTIRYTDNHSGGRLALRFVDIDDALAAAKQFVATGEWPDLKSLRRMDEVEAGYKGERSLT